MKYFAILVCLFTLLSCNSGANNYLATDIRLFKGTPVWKLAKAIEAHDTSLVKEILMKEPSLVNYKEKKFQISLLYWTIYHSTYYSKTYESNDFGYNYFDVAKILINAGADPFDKKKSAFLQAADVFFENSKYLELCMSSIQYKRLLPTEKAHFLNEALIIGCGRNREDLNGVKLLVAEGADINYFNSDSTATPLSESLIHENMNVARYLVVEKKVKYNYEINNGIDDSKRSIMFFIDTAEFKEEPEKQKLLNEIRVYIKMNEN